MLRCWRNARIFRVENRSRNIFTGIRAMGAASMVTSESEISDASGSHVVTATSVLLVGEGEQ